MSLTLAQVFALNPVTTIQNNDLIYLVNSPYASGDDAAILGSDLIAQFGSGSVNPGIINQLAWYAASGDTVSGLATGNNGVLITSAGGVPSISSTLPNVVQANITRLGTVISGVWNGTLIGATFGGTGVNNGANTATFAGNLNFANSFTTVGNFSVTQTYTGATNVTFPTTGTLATTSQLLVSPLNTKGDIWVWSTTNDRLPVATGDGKVLQVSSGAATGLAWSTATYPSSSGISGKFLISDGTNNVYSTSTIPISSGATANKVLLSDGTNYVLSTPTFPNASATTGKIIISDGTNWIASAPTYPAAAGASGNVMTSDGTNWISSTSGGSGTVSSGSINQLAWYAANGTTVSGLTTANSGVLVTSSGGVPSISSTLPAFTTSEITFSPTTGGIVGTTTNDNATAGKVGEFVSSVIPVASAVSILSATAKDLTSISLTAGDWDVWGLVHVIGTSVLSYTYGWISTTSATLPDYSLVGGIGVIGTNNINDCGIAVPAVRVNVNTTTTVYISSQINIISGTATMCGGIYARRVR